MIKFIVKNFKCFIDATILLNRLTILVGANGVGKSSVIQALLLLRNSFEAYQNNTHQVALNNSRMMLGTADAVLCQMSDEQSIRLSLEDEIEGGNMTSCYYTVDMDENQLNLNIKEFSHQGVSVITKPYFYYLCAERLGPRIAQSLQCLPYIDVGSNGQYTAQVLSYLGGMLKIDENRMMKGTKNRGLQAQVNEWLSKILPGVHVSATQDLNSMIAQIRIDNHRDMSPILAPNIGFGISYVLPIIVAGLTVNSGSLFIVENPEAHLHPAAQSAIGEFLGLVAQSGVYVIVETHSDHVINGIQLFVAEHQDFHDKVTIQNFSLAQNSIQPFVDSLSINEMGELSDWPAGFFDQGQIDFMKLQRLRMRYV